ncbi:DNA polymerase subunit gamma-1, mitochondrial [Episyrphus balteatus]|uniref:DNA polymerase subunit gamma-1, mitochondrial n=1 Tax=Episyrphus balteatus TaxID=286459 RepID=UPI00248617E0|nr:DNA polymerase subunit gamma-1, mitochondrial [Episyrphus balteatus]
MKHIIRNYSEIYPHSTVKIYRKSNPPLPPSPKPSKPSKDAIPQKPPQPLEPTTSPVSPEYRENPMKVQMLSENLYKQVFGKDLITIPDKTLVSKCIKELAKHGIDIGTNTKMKDVQLKLPPLRGQNIEEHFMTIGKEQSEPYRLLIQSLLKNHVEPPKKWVMKPGWTCYKENGPIQVPFPEEAGLIFDVEVCVTSGPVPTMATAVGNKYFYSWVSPHLINPNISPNDSRKYSLDELIPLGNVQLIVGHNVSYDRARIREQYLIQDTGTRFLDTMSLHVCVSGVTSYQRAIMKSKKEVSEEDLEWTAQSSLNSLAEVHRLYCGQELAKEARQTFVTGSLQDVKDDFQNLMNYCSSDVLATKNVLKELYPMFCERFPHPVTLAGMLELGSAYLPVNSNWNRYIEECNLTYEDLDIESKYHLSKRADAACQLMNDDKYKQDLWMWNEDWSTQSIKMKKAPIRKKKVISEENENLEETELDPLEKKFQYLYDTKSLLPARRPLLPGYPAWYRKICSKPNLNDTTEEWSPGANQIGTGMQIAPKLLSLCWEGYPLHYIREQGWGFLIPFRESHPEGVDSKNIPIEGLVEKCPVMSFVDSEASADESAEAFANLWKDVESNISKKDYYTKKRKDKTAGKYEGTGVWCNQTLEDCCWFLKLPHKNGRSFRVGNPLAKDFLNKFSDNVLTGDGDKSAERVIDIARMLSYWRNNRDRIMGQLVCWLPRESLPSDLQTEEREYGAIIPQVVVCGTLTRRAMEPTWMTASNAQRERVGSELRSMIQAPQGYRIVGADVDSQELWIASVLGDAHATGMHGATPFGWMTLSGSKGNGTDMHSVTAEAVGISRDHAKVINYARIYGAGQNFAERLLKQFNPTFSEAEARSKAKKMFSLTKGKKTYRMLEEFKDEEDDYNDRDFSAYEAIGMARTTNKSVPELFSKSRWQGGTESAMFNRLEDISSQDHPVTPFLNCRLSRALEPKDGVDDRFLPTRVNWVVQSGAVDFLHLMLVSMRWLMGNNVRFCLSFHDELRYLVREDLAYKAALAMHATNLLTRSFCVHRIGLKDLPMSVAFFSAVEVDQVLRKESSMDGKTPSNPHGLTNGYGIPLGESLDVYKTIEKAGGSDMSQWEWHKGKEDK